jgi:hypothetical protein
MPGSAHHCPFLNRSDERCAAHFSLNGMTEAFEQCFDQYAACAVYRELLLERRVRRAEAAILLRPGQVTRERGNSAVPDRRNETPQDRPHATPIVPLTFSAIQHARH